MKTKKNLIAIIVAGLFISCMILGGKWMYNNGYDPQNKPSIMAQSAMMGW